MLVNPASNPDHADPANWRPSVAVGGSPGGTDATTFSGEPDALINYALGATQGALRAGFIGAESQQYPAFTFPKNHAADDVVLEVEYSTDLIRWHADAILAEAPHGEEQWRVPNFSDARTFWRLQVSLRE